jgi:hypothetical protein
MEISASQLKGLGGLRNGSVAVGGRWENIPDVR